METEILCCLLGLAVGIAASRCVKQPTLKKQAAAALSSKQAAKANKLEKLLHNIEAYDGTEKNQLLIGIEED